MRKTLVFVNYEHPSQIRDRTRRHIVSTHTGKYSQELLRGGRPTGGHERDARESGITNEETSACRQPRPSCQSPQLAKVPPRRVRRAGSCSPFRRGMIIREKRRCLFSWQTRDQRLSTSPSVATRHQYSQQVSPTSDQWTGSVKDDNAIGKEMAWTVKGSSRPQSPLSIFGQGRVDPFARFAVDEDYTPFREAIGHGQSWLLL